MDKNRLKKFAAAARTALRQAVTKRLGHYGIGSGVIHEARRQGDTFLVQDVLGQDVILSQWEYTQQGRLVDAVRRRGIESIVEEVAYTIFNRLIAIRYMEINDYLPTHDRVLSGSDGSAEPEIVTNAPDIGLDLSADERERVYTYKEENHLDDLFRFLFFKECAALGDILPGLFTPAEGYVELLFDLSYVAPDGVIRELLALGEDDFRDQVAIIGWMYQYYNAEVKDETFALLKKNVKISKNRIPSATQLFTPDWIVRYMVENSLGRLWLDGHEKDPSFDWKYYIDEAAQAAEVQAQLEALRKDAAALQPEDITLIDPCMGSGHILVYAFDVLMDIYRSQGYRDRDAVQAILAHNLYGLDIDERAWQLAYFAVMMKARQYDSRIFRRNVSCHLYYFADTKDIDRESLSHFGGGLDELTRNVVLPQLEGLVDTFADAREYGSLLHVEPYDWELLHQYVDHIDDTKGGDLFVGNLADTQQRLQHLVSVAEILANQYDVVVTNPPYMGSGNMNKNLSNFIKKNYKDYKSDMFSSCMVRCMELVKPTGYLGFLTPYVWMFIASYEKLRKLCIEEKTIETLIQFEYSAFEEATVPICTFVLQNQHVHKKGCYLRLTAYKGGMEVQRQKALEAIETHDKMMYFTADAENFTKIPGSPIAYWIGESAIKNFQVDMKIEDVSETRIGMATANNNLFMRQWQEVSFSTMGLGYDSRDSAQKSEKKWFPYCKGGNFRKWYGNWDYVVNWEKDGWEIRNFKNEETGKIRSHNYNLEYIFRPGLTFTAISSSNFACRIMDNALFGSGGSGICNIAEQYTFSLLGLLNSIVLKYLVSCLSLTMNFEVNTIGSIPYLLETKRHDIDTLVQQNISFSKEDWDSFETSWDFQGHPLLPSVGDDFNRPAISLSTPLAEAYEKVKASVNARFDQLKHNEEELNRIFIDIYGLGDELTPDVADKDVTVARIYDNKDDIPDSMKGNAYVLTKQDVAKSFISYAVGCMFGRYSLDTPGLAYAGGAWDDSHYKTYIPDRDNVLPITDSEYFDDDIVTGLIDFVRTVYGAETLEQNLQWLADALGGRGTVKDVLRKYFLTDFYKDHVKTYKKRPIYWLFDSGRKNGFKALVYLHRYTPDLVGRVRTEYLHVLQRKLQERVERIDQTLLLATTKPADKARLNKEKTHLVGQLAEMQPYEEAMAHVAYQRLPLDLDDGVKVNYEKFQHSTITHDDGLTKTLPLLAKI